MSPAPSAETRALRLLGAFLDRLRAVRVLDPACGSGNFLYIALQALKDLEFEAIGWGSLVLRIPQQFPGIGPEAVLGIEINPYAAEFIVGNPPFLGRKFFLGAVGPDYAAALGSSPRTWCNSASSSRLIS